MPIVYGGLLPKAYGTSMNAQRCANAFKSLKQVFSFRNESKTTTLAKPKPCSYVLSCLAMFYSKVFARRLLSFLLFVGHSSFLIELYMPLRSVSLI